MADAIAMIRTCANRQAALQDERLISWDGQRLTVDGYVGFHIEVRTPEALAASILYLADLRDSTPQEISAFVAWLPLVSFVFSSTSIRRWRELYRQQKAL